MAMNKAEQAAFEALRHEIRLCQALRFSEAPEPQRMDLPERGHLNGWLFNAYSTTVQKAWTQRVSHGDGHPTDDEIANRWKSHKWMGSQNGVRLYATERDALIALRKKKEREFAEALAKLDALIEAATP